MIIPLGAVFVDKDEEHFDIEDLMRPVASVPSAPRMVVGFLDTDRNRSYYVVLRGVLVDEVLDSYTAYGYFTQAEGARR